VSAHRDFDSLRGGGGWGGVGRYQILKILDLSWATALP
jgi:hypothetical protein